MGAQTHYKEIRTMAKLTQEQVLDLTSEWHADARKVNPSCKPAPPHGYIEKQSLHEYIGWTWEQYKAYLEKGIIPERCSACEGSNIQTDTDILAKAFTGQAIKHYLCSDCGFAWEEPVGEKMDSHERATAIMFLATGKGREGMTKKECEKLLQELLVSANLKQKDTYNRLQERVATESAKNLEVAFFFKTAFKVMDELHAKQTQIERKHIMAMAFKDAYSPQTTIPTKAHTKPLTGTDIHDEGLGIKESHHKEG